MDKLPHSYKVNIAGESFQIRSDQSSQAVERIAAYLDLKIRESPWVPGSAGGEKFRQAVLAALNIAGELFEAREHLDECKRVNGQLIEKAGRLGAALDKALERQGGG